MRQYFVYTLRCVDAIIIYYEGIGVIYNVRYVPAPGVTVWGSPLFVIAVEVTQNEEELQWAVYLVFFF